MITQNALQLIFEDLQKQGYCLIKTGLTDEQSILDYHLEVSKAIGPLREHNQGMEDYIWPICLKASESELITFSEHDKEAELHTDSQYSEIPERYMGLSCIHPASCGGGANYLLDSERLLPEIQSDNELYEALSLIYPIAIPDIFQSTGHTTIEKPLIDRYPKFRYRYDTIKKGLQLKETPTHDIRWKVLTNLNELIENSPLIERITLAQGDILLVDNHRVLHGRTSFTDPHRLLYRIRIDEHSN